MGDSVVTARCVITHRLEGSRFGPCLKPMVFSLGACLSENVIKQAAPANVSTHDRCIGALGDDRPHKLRRSAIFIANRRKKMRAAPLGATSDLRLRRLG